MYLFTGPCGGKTTGQSRLCTFFENLGWKVSCVIFIRFFTPVEYKFIFLQVGRRIKHTYMHYDFKCLYAKGITVQKLAAGSDLMSVIKMSYFKEVT